MPDVITVACDVCGAQRREVNRWWIVWAMHDDEFHAMEFNARRWKLLHDGSMTAPTATAVACGEEHVHELFSRWLVSRTFLAPSQRPVSSSEPANPPKPAPGVGGPSSPSPAPLPETENEK